MKTLLLIAILLQAPGAATSKISGHVTTLPKVSMPSTLTLRIYGQGGDQMVLRPIPVSADGSFEISGIAPGEFSISLGAPFRSPSRNFFIKDGNVTDFEIKVPTEIPVRVVMTDGSAFAAGPIELVATTPVSATNINRAAPKIMTGRTQFSAGGNFTLTVFPGENSIRVENLPVGYVVKSITCGGVDLQHNPLQLDSTPSSPILVTLDRQ